MKKPIRVLRAQGGTGEQVVDVAKLDIPDLWHIAQAVSADKDLGKEYALKCAKEILDVWHMAHELKNALLIVADQVDTTEPISTKL